MKKYVAWLKTLFGDRGWARILLPIALVPAVACAQNATVSVDAGKALGTMSPDALGIGVAVWDGHMGDAAVPSLIKNAGFKVIRYPGGSYADIYHWKTSSSTKGMTATIQPGTDFDAFMKIARQSGTMPLITVNYGTNPEGTGGADPQEAADWVRYANKVKRYGVRYWEIGNEIYGNGFYNGEGWEADFHAPDTHRKEDRLQNPKLGPSEYGRNMVLFVRAMKAVDPTIKIGAVLTGPGDWPHGVAPDWNSNVLKECGGVIDFVVVHWYGYGKSPLEVIRSVDTVPDKLRRLRKEIDSNCGANAKNVQIWMTEGDASSYNTRPAGALFAAHHLLTWWESGATHVDWWDLHNGATKAFDGALDDQGILSNGSTVGELKEPPANTPFPPYYGVQMVSRIARPGDAFVRATSDSQSVIAHAVRRADGKLGLMLINTDSAHEARVQIHIEGWIAGERAIRYDYLPGTNLIRRTAVQVAMSVSVPPFAITDIIMDGR